VCAWSGVGIWIEELGEGVALRSRVAITRGWAEGFSVRADVFVRVVWAGERLDLALGEGREVVWVGFVGCVVSVGVEVCCLKGSVEAELGDGYGGGCFCLAVGGDEAAGCWDHVFAFKASAVHAVCEGTCAIPGRSEDVVAAF
jgi:hypothetical protein